MWSEIYGEDSRFAGHVRVGGSLLTADAEIARVVLDHRGAQKLVPVRGGNGQGGDPNGPCAVDSRFSDEGVEKRCRRESEQRLAVAMITGRAEGSGPVRHRKGVFYLRIRFGVTCEEAGQEAVGL